MPGLRADNDVQHEHREVGNAVATVLSRNASDVLFTVPYSSNVWRMPIAEWEKLNVP